MKQFLTFVRKEFFHIFRDSRTMLILLVMPVVLTLLFGYAITTEVKDSRVAVVDFSKDELTRRITDRLATHSYFTLCAAYENVSAAEKAFLRGEIDMVIVFPTGFAADFHHGGNTSVQLLIDGSEPNQASVRTGYTEKVMASFMQELHSGKPMSTSMQIIPEVRMLYNPQLKSEYNFVPGVIGLILMLICALMSSVSIVKEKETGTMEILLASPLPPIIIILAKLVPYFVIACTNIATILMLSYFLMGVPMAGSLFCFLGISLVYILACLSLGLLISTLVSTQLAAMLLSLLLIVPSLYFSGLAFPLESMPTALQNISSIVPARWYVSAARKLMIQGVEARHVIRELGVLTLMTFMLITISLSLFKKRLE